MAFAVTIHEKSGQPRRQEFDKTEVTIGRVQGNDIILPKQNVSKRHSRIVVKDGKFIIVDLKSTNGTYVNGRKIASPMVIKETDKIYIGDFILSAEPIDDAGTKHLPWLILGPSTTPADSEAAGCTRTDCDFSEGAVSTTTSAPWPTSSRARSTRACSGATAISAYSCTCTCTCTCTCSRTCQSKPFGGRRTPCTGSLSG